MDMVEVKAWHTVGKELKIESNLEDMKFDIRRNPDYFVEFIKSGETMLKVKTDITPAMFNADIETIVYLPSHSLFHKVFCMYGRGCFNKRQGHMKISVDRVNKNALISKFKVEFDVVKDDDEVIQIQITGDTTSAPYNFEFLAPNLFKKMGSSIDRATVTVNHQKGKSLNIKSNICGGLEHLRAEGPVLRPQDQHRRLPPAHPLHVQDDQGRERETCGQVCA